MVRCEICHAKNIYLKHKVDSFNYYLCSFCQTLFLCPKPNKQKNDNYYKNDLDYSNGKLNKGKIRLQARKIIKKLKKYNKNGKSLLDIGAGYGYLIDQAKKTGLHPIGIEPAKKILNVNNKRISPLTFDLYRKNNINKKFDYITLIHVVEHLTNPKKTLNEAISMLNHKGLLYIETPNFDSHLYNQEKINYTFLTPPVHQWVFSQNSFIKLLKNNKNVRIEEITTYSYSEHLMKVIKSFFTKKIFQSQIKTSTDNGQKKLLKKAKYIFFDQTIAPLFVWTLNLFNKGTFLQIYIKKI